MRLFDSCTSTHTCVTNPPAAGRPGQEGCCCFGSTGCSGGLISRITQWQLQRRFSRPQTKLAGHCLSQLTDLCVFPCIRNTVIHFNHFESIRVWCWRVCNSCEKEVLNSIESALVYFQSLKFYCFSYLSITYC